MEVRDLSNIAATLHHGYQQGKVRSVQEVEVSFSLMVCADRLL